MTLVFMAMLGVQIHLMRKFRDQIIALHYYVVTIVSLSLLQCIFNWAIYGYMNRVGEHSRMLTFLGIMIEILRSTFARVVTLVVALGYGILIKSI